MAQLNIKLDPERLEALRRYAARRRTPVAGLIEDYVAYPLAGGEPVGPQFDDDPASDQLALLLRVRAVTCSEPPPALTAPVGGCPAPCRSRGQNSRSPPSRETA